MTKQKYIQCKIEKVLKSTSAKIYEVAYIPKDFSVKNKIIKLLKDDGSWEHGWKVVEVFKDTETDEPPDWRKLIRGHRDNTGDSLLK